MSILAQDDTGWLISQEKYFNRIEVLEASGKIKILKLNPNLFEITEPFVKGNIEDHILSPTSKLVKDSSESLLCLGKDLNIFEKSTNSNPKISKSNQIARKTASEFFDRMKDMKLSEINSSGGNCGESSVVYEYLGNSFLFQNNTRFHLRNVLEMEEQLNGEKYNVIVMDPPWWNRYIRRRKRKQAEAGYQLLENLQIQNLPIEQICEENGLVFVWCTNSKTHQNQLIDFIFPKWGLEFLCVWHWLKVTKSGHPICPFNEEGKKQPYETIIIGRRPQRCNSTNESDISSESKLEQTKVIISVPSSINSHKPPLIDVIRQYFFNEDDDPKCLEIFSRYLIPNFTSYGNETIKLQHCSLYV